MTNVIAIYLWSSKEFSSWHISCRQEFKLSKEDVVNRGKLEFGKTTTRKSLFPVNFLQTCTCHSSTTALVQCFQTTHIYIWSYATTILGRQTGSKWLLYNTANEMSSSVWQPFRTGWMSQNCFPWRPWENVMCLRIISIKQVHCPGINGCCKILVRPASIYCSMAIIRPCQKKCKHTL